MSRIIFALLIAAIISPVGVGAQVPRPGSREWRFIAGGPIVGWPALDSDGRFYFTAEDRFLYALDRDGLMRWRTDLGRRSAGMVAVGPDQSIYVGLEDGRLLAINKDGRLIWEIGLSRDELLPPIVLSNGTVIASDETGSVVALSHTGFTIWEISLGESLSSSPVVDFDGQMVFGTVRGNIFTIDQSGRIAGRRYVGDVPSVVAPYRDGLLIGTTSGRVVNLSSDGEPLWRTDLGSAVADLLIDAQTNTYARVDDGSLLHLSHSGVITWRANPPPGGVNSLTAAQGVLVGISGESLAHIRPDGTLSWQIGLPSEPLALSLSDRSTLFVSTTSWVTYSYPIELEIDGVWPVVRGTLAATGVPPDVVVSRPGFADFSENLDFIYLSEFIRSPFENDQLAGLDEIARRITPRELSPAGGAEVGDRGSRVGFAGSYPYVLALCEDVAGAPYFGPVGFDGRILVGRNARSRAISILGLIGDLNTSRYLLRLLQAEEAVDVQVEILGALASLGTSASGEALGVVSQVVESHSALNASDQLAAAAVTYLEAVYDYEGGFLSADGVSLLTHIMSGPFGGSVREAARAALSGFSERE